jgi:hypothetical protein
VSPTAQSNLRLYPADAASEPVVSNLNWLAGDSATPNKVDVKLSSTGAVKIAVANGTVNVLGDVVGYYTNATLKELQGDVDALEASKADTADVNSALLNRTTWTASVNSTGGKLGTGNFTSSRTANGAYRVAWDFTGLGYPNVSFNHVATTKSIGCNASITSQTRVDDADGLTSIAIVVKTTNNAGSAIDCPFFAMSMLPAPDVVTPPISLLGGASLESAALAATATCTTEADITTCVD